MAYIKDVQVGSDTYLIEPTLYIAPTKNGAAYTATLANFSLATGATVQAKFAATNNENATLNISSTGAKEIHYNGDKITANQFKVNHVYTLVYDGTQWQVVGDIDTNTNTWRGIQDNLTSDSTTESLSAKQGKVLKGLIDAMDATTPAASGNATAFIDSITQTNGKITSITKKNIPTVSSSTAGLAPKGTAVSTQSTSTKFLREDGSWATPSYITNTDAKVAQSSNTEDKEFPIILKNTDNTTNETNGVKYDGDVTVNPSKSKITATTIQANSRLVASKAISQIITGTGTAGSYTNSTYHPAKWTFNTGLTATDGDIFTIKIPVAGHDYGVFMSIDNGSHYYPVVLNGTGRITTHYPVNTYLTVIFEPTGSAASMYAVAGQTSSTRITVTGGVWRVLNYYDSNSNDTGYYHRRIYPNLKAGTGSVDKYTIIMQLPNGRWSSIVQAPSWTTNSSGSVIPKDTGKSASANGFMLGHVLLMYANATYADGANIGTYNIWSAHTGLIDARYSFNLANSTGNGFVAYTPVYIVGTVSDGLFHLDATKWWTQTLPSSDDGKVYIYIGDAYDWYRLTFTEDKPMYWYKDGAIRLYSGASEYALSAPLSGISDADDLKAIEAISGTSGLLKKTAANTWTLDINSYVTSSGVTKVSTGAGLTGGDITTTGTVKANLTNETKLTNAAADGTETSGRVYPVRLDKNGKLAVNVPWTNVNSSYLPLTGGIMTGNIRRYYNTASTEPMITMLSNNQDIILWEAGHGTAAATTTTSNHYKLLYKGTGQDGDNSNCLQLIAHKTDDIIAIQIDEIGKITLPQMATGGAKTPIYINSNGVITAGDALKDLAYISKGSGTTKFLREDGTWQTALTAHQSLAGYKTRQTKSKSLTTIGWYRILDCTASSMAFFITFYGNYNNQPPTPVTFLVSHAYNTTEIEQIGRSANIGWIQKLRAVHYDTSKFYIDVYYAGPKANTGAFEITPLDPNARSNITLIDFTAITDSVTVNASCTTSLESHADKAELSKTLANYYTSRPENANITHVNNGGIIHFKATSKMTSNKPMGDGSILHFYWDNENAWNSQLYMPDSSGNSMQWRSSSAAGTWASWKTILDSDNYTDYTVTKDGTGATGTWNIAISGQAGSVAWANTGHPSTFPPSAHTHYELATIGDKRNEDTTPNTYKNRIIFQGLKKNSAIGSPYTDTYSYLVGLRGWSDSSGGNSHELAFNINGIYHRQGATDTWGDWLHLLDSDNTTAGTNNAATLTWNTTYTIAKINGTDIKFTTMAKPSYAFTDLTAHPTTLSGYGITDAKIASGVITLGSNTITPVTSVNGHTGKSVNVTAADLGLSNALHFIGITSTELADESTTATLTPKSTNSLSKTTGFVDGDVVMDGDQLREYVWSGDAWRLLGITTSTAYTQPTSTATNTWIAQVSQGTDGRITATTGSLDTSGEWSGNAATTTKVYVTNTIPSSTTTYFLTYTNSTTSGNQDLRNTSRLYYYDTGTSSYLNVGNASNSGGLTLHNSNGKYASIVTQAFSANHTITLPDTTGTIALTSSNITGTAANVTGTVAIAHGGTGKTTALDAITNLGGVYLLANGKEVTASSNLDSDYKAMGTYYSPNSTRTGTLAGTVIPMSSGFKMYTIIGYRTATLRQFLAGADERLFYRSSQDTGSTWGKWYQLVRLPAGNDNKTFAAIGEATTPIYINAKGEVQEGDALKNLAYKDSLTSTDIPDNAANTTGNAATATAIETAGTTAQFYRGDNSWSDTISGGTLKITNNSNTVTIGSQNTSFTHIYNSANIPFIFNKDVLGTANSNLGSTAQPWGNLYIGAKNSRSIYYVGTKATKAMITFLDNTSDANGNGIKIGGGGVVVVGAGESAANMSVTVTSETLYLTSDGTINIEAGGDTIANRIGMQVTSSGHVIPVKAEAENSNAQNLGASDSRWAKLYIGTTDSYGDAYTPIYWNSGVPAAVTLVQYCEFTIGSGKKGVKLTHAAFTAASYVTQIVVTSGESNLNSTIAWESATGYINLTCNATSGAVSGYILVSRGGAITATATDIT